MLRPASFMQPYVAFSNIPYLCGEQSVREFSPGSGGVLGRGQTVWTQEAYNSRTVPVVAIAFVDEIGIISLDPRGLVPADLLSLPVV